MFITEQAFQGIVPLIIQNEKTPKFISWMKICHQWKNNRLGSRILPMLALYISAILVFVECVMKCEEVVTRICGHQFKIGCFAQKSFLEKLLWNCHFIGVHFISHQFYCFIMVAFFRNRDFYLMTISRKNDLTEIPSISEP